MSARVGGTFTTDSVSYTARPTGRAGRSIQYAFTVIAQLENRGDVPVYIPRCYPNSPQPLYSVEPEDTAGAAQQRMQNRPAYDQIWACVGHDYPFEVWPGTTRVDTLRLVGPTAWDGRTGEGIGRVEGRFRLGYHGGVCRRRSDLCRRPDSTWYSNAFSVRVER
jgi:hypothetical protein